MTKNRIVKYVANTALLAVLAAAGIGAYQIGTYTPEKKLQEEIPSDTEKDSEEISMVDVDASLVDSEISDTMQNKNTEEELGTSEKEESLDTQMDSMQTNMETKASDTEKNTDTSLSVQEEVKDVSAGAVNTAKLNFSEDTLMEWPVHGNILLDYNMDQTVYYATLDQYKLSPSIVVGAEEGAPVTCSVKGKVYSVEEDPQTGTTLTMELGDGYQAVYGQLKDLTVKEGDIVEKGTVIGYINAPTRYYSSEGSNLYFAMEKSGEPVDPIAYLP